MTLRPRRRTYKPQAAAADSACVNFNGGFEQPMYPEVGIAAGGYGPTYPWNTPTTWDTFERATSWAASGTHSGHFVALDPSADFYSVVVINPDTFTADGDGFPSGFFPIVAGGIYRLSADTFGVSNSDYTADSGGVSVTIEWYDAGGSYLDESDGAQDSGAPHFEDGVAVPDVGVTGTAPAGAAWALLYFWASRGGGTTEFFLDNVCFKSVLGIIDPGPQAIPYGTAYSLTLTPIGDTPPDSWALTSGSLPPGLTLDSATGVISGTPTTLGSESSTITLTDSTAQTGQLTIAWTVVAPGFLKIGDYIAPELASITIDPAGFLWHGNRVWTSGWIGANSFTDDPYRLTHFLVRPLPPVFRPTSDQAIRIPFIPQELSNSDSVFTSSYLDTTLHTDGTWTIDGTGIPINDTGLYGEPYSLAFNDISWPVAPIPGASSVEPAGTDVSGVLTQGPNGHWSTPTTFTAANVDDGTGATRASFNGRIAFTGLTDYSPTTGYFTPVVDGTWQNAPAAGSVDAGAQALTNATTHTAGFDGGTVFVSYLGDNDLAIVAQLHLGPSAHAPGVDSGWWGIGMGQITGTPGPANTILMLLHNDSLGSGSKVALYEYDTVGHTLTHLADSSTYAGSSSSAPSSTDFFYQIKRLGNTIHFELWTTNPVFGTGAAIASGTYALDVGGVVKYGQDTGTSATGPEGMFLMMYALAGDTETRFYGAGIANDYPSKKTARWRDGGWAIQTVVPYGPFLPHVWLWGTDFFPDPAHQLPYQFQNPGRDDASPNAANWFSLKERASGRTKMFTFRQGAIQCFGDSPLNSSFVVENYDRALVGALNTTPAWTTPADTSFALQILSGTVPLGEDDGSGLGRRHLARQVTAYSASDFPPYGVGPGFYSPYAKYIYVSSEAIALDAAPGDGSFALIHRYNAADGSYYAFAHHQTAVDTVHWELWRVDPTAGSPVLLAAGSDLVEPHFTQAVLQFITWIDVNPTTGHNTVYWRAYYTNQWQDPAWGISNGGAFSLVASGNGLGKGSGGVELDILQGQMGRGTRGTTTGMSWEATYRAGTVSWKHAFFGVEDGESFDLDRVGYPTSLTGLRFASSTGAFERKSVGEAPTSPTTASHLWSDTVWTCDPTGADVPAAALPMFTRGLPPGITVASPHTGSTMPFAGTYTDIGLYIVRVTARQIDGQFDAGYALFVVEPAANFPALVNLNVGVPITPIMLTDYFSPSYATLLSRGVTFGKWFMGFPHLPSGLALDISTGVISGTPDTPGTTFCVPTAPIDIGGYRTYTGNVIEFVVS